MTGVLQVLMGAAAAGGTFVDFTYQGLTATTSTPGTGQTAQSGYVIRTDGQVEWQYIIDGASAPIGSPYILETAISPTTAVANYEVKATLTAGTTPSGAALGVWHPLSGVVDWYIGVYGALGTTTCSLNLEVRLIGTGTVLDTWAVDLVAVVTA